MFLPSIAEPMSPQKASVCPYCESRAIDSVRRPPLSIRIGRKPAKVEGLVESKCRNCKAEFETPDQHDRNVDAIATFRRNHAGITPKDIRMLRAKYQISQDQARQIFGGGKTAFSKYERGTTIPNEPTAKLLWLASESVDAMQRLA